MKNSVDWKSALVLEKHLASVFRVELAKQRNQRESRYKQSNRFDEISDCIGNGRQRSYWLARSTEWTASTHWLAHTTQRTNRRQEKALKNGRLRWFGKRQGRRCEIAACRELRSMGTTGDTTDFSNSLDDRSFIIRHVLKTDVNFRWTT